MTISFISNAQSAAIDASFTAILNAEKGDENYVALADVNNDGIINGKDYARLLNTFRN